VPTGISYSANAGFSGPDWEQWQGYIEEPYPDHWSEYGYNDASGDSFTVARNIGIATVADAVVLGVGRYRTF
jgi:hypothetical protein